MEHANREVRQAGIDRFPMRPVVARSVDARRIRPNEKDAHLVDGESFYAQEEVFQTGIDGMPGVASILGA